MHFYTDWIKRKKKGRGIGDGGVTSEAQEKLFISSYHMKNILSPRRLTQCPLYGRLVHLSQ